MQTLPHHYAAAARATVESDVALESAGLPQLVTASPAEFGGPGDRWSPETLLVASIADCFILTFRAVADGSKLPWLSLECGVTGTLDKVDRAMQFTRFEVRAALRVPEGTDVARAERVLAKAEQVCLITSSLKGESHLIADVTVG